MSNMSLNITKFQIKMRSKNLMKKKYRETAVWLMTHYTTYKSML